MCILDAQNTHATEKKRTGQSDYGDDQGLEGRGMFDPVGMEFLYCLLSACRILELR